MATATYNRRKGLTEPTKNASSQYWLRAGHYDPEFVTAIEQELTRLSLLSRGWDGYGAPLIDPGIIAAALAFIKALPENLVFRPRVVPMSTGNLQFEWHHGSKILELEFETPQMIRFLLWHPEAGVEEEDTFRTNEIDTAVDLIQWFMSGTCV